MKLKRCMIMGITACLIIGSMSGCSSKENGNSQSNQKEQTIQTNQTEEEISENEDAFRSSCIWYFRKVIDEVGQETIQEELNKLDYGNCDISEWSGSGVNSFPELNGFWIESSLMISPIEQVEVLHKIMEGETIYTKSEIEILKSIMLLEASDSKKIYGKTGTGTDGTAWFIGFVEKENTNIYFAIYLDDDSSNEISGIKAQEIAFNILEE